MQTRIVRIFLNYSTVQLKAAKNAGAGSKRTVSQASAQHLGKILPQSSKITPSEQKPYFRTRH
jgi:hypothetical protein